MYSHHRHFIVFFILIFILTVHSIAYHMVMVVCHRWELSKYHTLAIWVGYDTIRQKYYFRLNEKTHIIHITRSYYKLCFLYFTRYPTDRIYWYRGIYLKDWSRREGVTATTPELRHRTANYEGVDSVTADRPWSISIITWLNNFEWKVLTTKYVQNVN